MQLPITKPHSSVNQCRRQTLYILYGSVCILPWTRLEELFCSWVSALVCADSLEVCFSGFYKGQLNSKEMEKNPSVLFSCAQTAVPAWWGSKKRGLYGCWCFCQHTAAESVGTGAGFRLWLVKRSLHTYFRSLSLSCISSYHLLAYGCHG